MTGPAPRRGFDWEAAGREVGATFGAYHAIVVIGTDPVATGHVAVGIGRAQAAVRRTAVGDLFAESPPIQALVASDDAHGLVDSFLYGVSLTRIAYEVPDAGQLFVMPSGSEAPPYNEILPSPRWARLAAGFREVGALLVLAAPANAPHIEKLVAATDGAVLVGESVPRKLPVATVITTVRDPRRASEAAEAPQTVPSRRRLTRRWPSVAAGIALSCALAGAAVWLAYRPLAGNDHRPARKAGTPKVMAAVVGLSAADSAMRDSAGGVPAVDSAAGPVVMAPTVADPGDSAGASPFAVELMAANTQAGAILKLQQDGKYLPGATFAPITIGGARWYQVIAGAFPARSGADSLLAMLRRRHVVDDSGGAVVRLPFAFLIDSGVPAAAVTGMVASYADRGQPVYALRQANGTAWLLAGAFESPDQSTVYAESLHASGTAPVLVYRKGRTF
jgi:hypothetical protein